MRGKNGKKKRKKSSIIPAGAVSAPLAFMIELFIFACAKQQTVVSGTGRDIAVGDWISLQKPEIGKFVGFDTKRVGGCQWLSVVRYVLENHIFDAMRAAASF